MDEVVPIETDYYNELTKSNYLIQFEIGTKMIINTIFTVSSILERHLDKDLAYFQLNQIRTVMFLLSPTTLSDSIMFLEHIKNYIDWHRKYDLSQEVNELDRFNDEWAIQFVSKKELIETKRKKTVRGVREVFYSDGDCIKTLIKFYQENGTTNSRVYRRLKLKPSYSYLTNRYGSWNQVIEFAGIIPENKSSGGRSRNKYSEEDCLRSVTDFYNTYNSISSDLYNRMNIRPYLQTMLPTLKCDTWGEILIKAGLGNIVQEMKTKKNEDAKREIMRYLKGFSTSDLRKIREFAQSLESENNSEKSTVAYESGCVRI